MDSKEKSEQLFQEFLSRLKSGEQVDPDEYIRKHPDLENDLRKLFARLDEKTEDTKPQSFSAHRQDIIGDFRIIKEIGKGGMGTVYEAEQISLNRKVALKVLPAHLSFSDEAVLKFRREAEAGGRQSHPGIVAIHAVGEYEGNHYIAQELVEGGITLANKIEEYRKRGEQPQGYFRDVAQFVSEVAEALQHAHESGVIHRDIKPTNILLSDDGHPKVTDFGLAKIEDALALSRTGDFAGTPYYMSPEQAMSRRIGIDHRTDIYSLGVTLYEMLTLNRPFEGNSSHEVLKKIIFHEPRDPRKVNPHIPRDMAVIALKAMEKNPDARYAAMMDFANDLILFQSGDVIKAKPSSPARKVLKYIRRNKVTSTAVGLVLVALAIIVVLISLYFIKLKMKNEEIRRLLDIDSMFRLKVEAENLLPAYPKNATQMENWLQEVKGLVERLDQHRQKLEKLKAISRLNNEKKILHNRLEELVSWLETISNNESGLIRRVKNHLHFARTIYNKSIEEKKQEWDSAIASIVNKKKCPQYNGLIIKPQLGFVPVGRNPLSGLWEFAHLQTGTNPERSVGMRLTLTETTGLVFVLIPGNTYNMGAIRPSNEKELGSPNIDPDAILNCGPVHSVTIKPFLLSKYEMTQGQWLRFTSKNPSSFKPGQNYGGGVVNPLHPLENVTWEDAVYVLSRLNLRLPSESEWEYACRAGTSTPYYFGSSKSELGVHAWFKGNSNLHTHPVGQKKANPFGLHDMYGNIHEWCGDVWTNSYNGAPQDGSVNLNPGSVEKVIRGGSWYCLARDGRSADRFPQPSNHHGHGIGVRPACSLR